MRHGIWILVLGVALSLAPRAWTQTPDDATQSEIIKLLDANPDKIFALADEVQTNPYGDRAMNIISVLTRYGLASKKITLTLGSLIQPFATTAHKDVELRLFGEYWTGLTMYAIEHDGKAGGTDASNLYAMNFLFKAYRTMLKQHPESHNSYADKLLNMSQTGKLAAYVHERVVADKAHPMPVSVGTPTPTPSVAPSTTPSASPTDTTLPIVPSPPPPSESPSNPSSPGTPGATGTGQL